MTAVYGGELDLPAGYTLALRPQPLVVPEHQTIDVTNADGATLIAESAVVDRPTVAGVAGAPQAD